jgi:hypothetical protein
MISSAISIVSLAVNLPIPLAAYQRTIVSESLIAVRRWSITVSRLSVSTSSKYSSSSSY